MLCLADMDNEALEVSAPAGRHAEVLLAEDDRELRRFLVEVLQRDGYRIIEAESGHDLLDRLWERSRSKCGFDLIISDNRMPGATGLAVLEGLRNECEPPIGDTPIILITAFGDPKVHAEAERLGAVVFDKPFDIDSLRECAVKMVKPVDPFDSLYCEHGGRG